jgi:Lrp/AsnC family transcriptional regulator, regulator for asnA, asnC and gidA
MRNSNPEEVVGRRGRRQEDLSDLDKRIIEHLQADGRRPFTQIAAALGVGVADPERLGFQQALIGIRCLPGRIVDAAEALAALPEVDYVVITAGRYDILIETVSEDNEGLLRFLDEQLQRIDGVRDTETFTYLRLVKQTYQFGTR